MKSSKAKLIHGSLLLMTTVSLLAADCLGQASHTNKPRASHKPIQMNTRTQKAAQIPYDSMSRSAYLQLMAKTWAWTNEAWTGNDAPYQKITTEVDGAFSRGENISSLLAKYRGLAARAPSDPIAQYRLGYLAFRADRQGHKDEYTNIMGNARVAMNAVPSPHAYSYDRLKYLLDHEFLSGDRHEQKLGERLLKRELTQSVSFAQAIQCGLIYDYNDASADLDRTWRQVDQDNVHALALAKAYTSRYPDDHEGHYALGMACSQMYVQTTKVAYRDSAIAEFKKYLTYWKPGTTGYTFVSNKIRKLNDGLIPYFGRFAFKDIS